MTLAELARVLGGSLEGATATVRCPVPGHGRKLGDRSPSLSVTVGRRNALVVHCHAGCNHRDVFAALRQLGIPNDAKVSRTGPAPEEGERSHWADLLWKRGKDCAGTLAETYMEGRGLGIRSSALRYLGSCKHPRPPRHNHPAMLAAFTDDLGNVTAVQRTYLARNGSKAVVEPVRLTLGKIGNSAIRLFAAGSDLGIAEGVETALSAHLLFRMPVWAAGGARIERIAVPAGVQRLFVFADNDPAGLTSAVAARRRFTKSGLHTEILHPDPKGSDWNDILLSGSGLSNGP